MAEQNRPLTDDPNPLPSDDSVSPLFNKMDALMARHRSPAGQHHEDIPVLTDIAPEAFDIPILTDVINEDLIQKIENIERSLAEAQSAKARRRLEEKLASENELAIPSLMFTPQTATTAKPAEVKTNSNPNSAPISTPISAPIAEIDLELTPPARFTPAARSAPVIEPPVFLDLPLLDLNAIEAAPVIPTGKAVTQIESATTGELQFVADDLIIDFSTPIDAEPSTELTINDFAEPEHPAATLEATHAFAATPVATDNSATSTTESQPIEATPAVILAEPAETHDPDLRNIDLAINLDPEPESAEANNFSALANTETSAPTLHWDDDDEQISISLSSLVEEPHLEITLDEISDNEGIKPEALIIESYSPIPGEENTEADAIQLSDVADEADIEAEIETETSPSLDADAIAELTAVVGAQLAVDIASEVEQLARQHFSKLMAQFYGDTLRELTGEISRELEERLAPRIVELVEQELISKGLIQK